MYKLLGQWCYGFCTEAFDTKVKVMSRCKQDDLFQRVNDHFAKDDFTINFVYLWKESRVNEKDAVEFIGECYNLLSYNATLWYVMLKKHCPA